MPSNLMPRFLVVVFMFWWWGRRGASGRGAPELINWYSSRIPGTCGENLRESGLNVPAPGHCRVRLKLLVLTKTRREK